MRKAVDGLYIIASLKAGSIIISDREREDFSILGLRGWMSSSFIKIGIVMKTGENTIRAIG